MVGAKEQETRTLNIRNRDDQDTQKLGELIPLDTALKRLGQLKSERTLDMKKIVWQMAGSDGSLGG